MCQNLRLRHVVEVKSHRRVRGSPSWRQGPSLLRGVFAMLHSPTSAFPGSQARPATQHMGTRPILTGSSPRLVPRLRTTGLPAPRLTSACGHSRQKCPACVRETSYVHTVELPRQYLPCPLYHHGR